jgi:hypothetical protein
MQIIRNPARVKAQAATKKQNLTMNGRGFFNATARPN